MRFFTLLQRWVVVAFIGFAGLEHLFCILREIIALGTNQCIVLEDHGHDVLHDLATTMLESGHIIPAIGIKGTGDRWGAQQCNNLSFGHPRMQLLNFLLLQKVTLLDIRLVDNAAATQGKA